MERIPDLSPYIRVAQDSVIHPSWTLRERVIFDYELLYVKAGRALVTAGDARYRAEPGDVFLFKPRQRHSIRVVGDEPFRQPHLHFDLVRRPDSESVRVCFRPLSAIAPEEMSLFREDDTAPGRPMELPTRLHIPHIDYFEFLLFEIIREHHALRPFGQVEVQGLFLRLWAYLLRAEHQRRHPGVHPGMQAVKEYIDSRPEEPVGLPELADRFHFSQYHLIRAFRRAYGVTPIRYSRMVRMRRARELLQYSGLTLEGVARTLRYADAQAFTRAFLRAEGVRPSAYRSGKDPRQD